MKDFVLSKRMKAVVNMVSPQSFAIADIGCDHAYVSITLMRDNIERKVIAMDVRKGPLEIAAKNVSECGLSDMIELRLSDGLEKLCQDEVDTIIIAGMGGLLIKSILENGEHIVKGSSKLSTLILQPQSDVIEVRRYLYEIGYHIEKETMLEEDGKYYTVIKAVFGRENATFSNVQWQYGAYELLHKDKVLLEYLQKEKNVLAGIYKQLEKSMQIKAKEEIPSKTVARFEKVKEDLQLNAEALCMIKEDSE